MKHSSVWLGLLVLVAIIAASIWSLANFWDWLQRIDAGAGESNSTTIRNGGLIVVTIIALPLAIWRSTVAHLQANTAQRGLLNERYQKGTEMLGSPLLSVRLGGVYALQSLAEEHPEQYHIQIMRLFCAFVRHPTKSTEDRDDSTKIIPVMDTQEESNSETEPKGCTREDVQAIMDAIGSRDGTRIAIERKNKFTLNLKAAELSGANLSEANLSGMNRPVYMTADLSDANLSGVDLSAANLSFTDLTGADLSGAILMGANLSNTYLSNTNLSGADLFCDGRGEHVTFESPVIGLTQAQLNQAYAAPNNPPKLDGTRDHVLDAKTSKPLIWRGKPLEDKRWTCRPED